MLKQGLRMILFVNIAERLNVQSVSWVATGNSYTEAV